jgi:hypothetical protein
LICHLYLAVREGVHFIFLNKSVDEFSLVVKECGLDLGACVVDQLNI